MIFLRAVQIAIMASAADKMRFLLSDSQCYERSIKVFFFFFWLFLLRMRGNLLIYRKMSISRLLWGDRWKPQGEIQRHAIVKTYMFMTNDRFEDSFV